MSHYTLPSIADWSFYQKVTGERVIESSAGITSRIYGNSELVLADSNGEGSFLRLYSGSNNRLFAFYGNILNAGTTNTLTSRQPDGSGIVGLDVDTLSAWIDPTARIQRWQTGGFERLSVMALTGALRNPSTAILESSIADTGSNVGIRTNTTNALTTSRPYLAIATGDVNQWKFYNDGSGVRTIQATDGALSQILGNGSLTLLNTIGGISRLELASTNAAISCTGGGVSVFSTTAAVSITAKTLIYSKSTAADSSTSIAFAIDTDPVWTNPTAKSQVWATGGTEKAYMLAAGVLVAAGISSSHLSSTQTSPPTVVANAAAGTGATASLSRASDSAMLLTLITGTIVGLVLGNQLTITFANAFGDKPIVMMTPANSAAALLTTGQAYPDEASVSASAVSIFASIALAASTTYKWYVTVIGK